MNAKHQFKYTYNETDLEEYSPVEVTFEVPGDVTLTQMLYNFERYLQAAGFVFDGHLELVKDGFDDAIWPSDSDSWPDSCGDYIKTDCVGKSYEVPKSDSYTIKNEEYEESRRKAEAEMKKNIWVHGMCNPPSPDHSNCCKNK